MWWKSLAVSAMGILVSGGLAWGQAVQPNLPSIEANDWTFVFVPTFDGSDNDASNNLSVVGLNRSLLFAQLLDSALAGQEDLVRAVMAVSPKKGGPDMATLETIEPFALLHSRGLDVTTVDVTNPEAWDSPANFIGGILASDPKGVYVIAAPPSVVESMVLGLPGAKPRPPSEYYLATSATAEGPFKLDSYAGFLGDITTYPQPTLPTPLSACAAQPSVTFVLQPPKDFMPFPNQTVHMVRHVEAHPTPAFENGNYVCQGQWRALGMPDTLLEMMGGDPPDYVYAPNPAGLTRCQEGGCSYIRATLTVAPFAIKNNLPLTLAQFGWDNGTDLAEALFNPASPYFPRTKPGGETILVGWEHDHIVKSAKYLIAELYQNPKAAKQLPDWAFNDYDSIWTFRTDDKGVLTFSNGCELINSASLPSTCPAFFPKN